MVQRTILRLPFPGGRPGPKPGPYLLDGVGYSRQAKVQSDDAALVFVSYSRGDHEWRAKFVEMLQPVLRERGLVVWSDERNLAGEAWRPPIAGAIERACAALLLVSPAFLNSEFVMGQELPALLARDIPLFCVLVRPCLFDEVPALEALQWAHDPGRDGALLDAPNREGQIVRVCRRVL